MGNNQTCWCNAAVQVLLHNKNFSDFIINAHNVYSESLKNGKDCTKAGIVVSELFRVLNGVIDHLSETPLLYLEHVASIENDMVELTSQQESYEFIIWLLDTIEVYLKSYGARIFGFHYCCYNRVNIKTVGPIIDESYLCKFQENGFYEYQSGEVITDVSLILECP